MKFYVLSRVFLPDLQDNLLDSVDKNSLVDYFTVSWFDDEDGRLHQDGAVWQDKYGWHSSDIGYQTLKNPHINKRIKMVKHFIMEGEPPARHYWVDNGRVKSGSSSDSKSYLFKV